MPWSKISLRAVSPPQNVRGLQRSFSICMRLRRHETTTNSRCTLVATTSPSISRLGQQRALGLPSRDTGCPGVTDRLAWMWSYFLAMAVQLTRSGASSLTLSVALGLRATGWINGPRDVGHLDTNDA